MTEATIFKNKVKGSKYYSYKMTFPKAIAKSDGFGDSTKVKIERYGDDYILKRVKD